MKMLERNPERTTFLESSFIVQRRGMAVLAAIFPVAFLLSSLLGRTEFQTSISAYYWTLDPERNVFVGVLCAIAVFLLLYKGYTPLEDRVLDLAGLCAAGVAFVPIAKGSDCGAASGLSAHGAFAVTFFLCLAFICVFMSEQSLKSMPDPNRRSHFRWAYRICAGAMILLIGLAVASRFLPGGVLEAMCRRGATFWLEALAIWTFAAFWYVKTRELDPFHSWVPFKSWVLGAGKRTAHGGVA
jgi:hypothetical protein